MRRVVEPELLDDLPPADPRAVGSRGDLRRLNVIMGHHAILLQSFRHHLTEPFIRSRPLRLVELGAGDGTLLLRLARRLSASGMIAQVTLLDRQNLLSAETRHAFVALHWSVENVATDVFTWLEQSPSSVDVVLANLFLHHFPDKQLGTLLRLAAAKANLIIACEPRRSLLTLAASRLLWLMGCNSVTRHDAVVSVRAGFAGHEISALWPSDTNWKASEQSAGLFSHCFVAERNA